MKNKDNIQPALNPKPLNIQWFLNRDTEGKIETLLIHNVSVDPRELIRN